MSEIPVSNIACCPKTAALLSATNGGRYGRETGKRKEKTI
jgi:hypothetical protein